MFMDAEQTKYVCFFLADIQLPLMADNIKDVVFKITDEALEQTILYSPVSNNDGGIIWHTVILNAVF